MNVKFEVHPKAKPGRCREARKSLELSVIEDDKTVLTIPARLILEQNNWAQSMQNTHLPREVEASVMKHVQANFLSWLHLRNLNIVSILFLMASSIEAYKKEHNYA